VRKLWVGLAILVVLVVGGAFAASALAQPEVGWRLAVLGSKLRGDLPEMPLRDLLRWLLPGSPVYLQALAESPNPHAAIRNVVVDAKAVQRGETLYREHCGQCHGDAGRGHVGPNLVQAVQLKSDWSFFATTKWGRPGTAMAAQPLEEAAIWQVHAYLRSVGLGRGEARPATTRPRVDVKPQQILEADRDPSQWLTYAGNYLGHRHSLLAQVTKENVGRLRLAWAAQLRQVDRELQASPIVAGGIMFVSESREGVVALDAATGETLWTFRRAVPDGLSLCCGMPNRGVAILGDTVFVATIDAHLVALDANSGRQRWIAKVADWRDGYSMTGAPLALADRVVVGVAGGEFGIRGFLAAYGAADGKPLWKFNTVPGPGEPGHETWGGDSWKTGGAPTWATGAYDAKQDLVIWGVGNPGPTYFKDARRGDNLYSNSVIALEAASGKLRWHYQFTPGDTHDWDAAQQPILAEIDWQGRRRPVVLWANRNAFFYAVDRTSGEFLFAKPFVKQTWNEGFDAKGRPRVAAGSEPTPNGTLVWPAIMSATHWWPPSYDAARQLVFVPSSDAAGMYFRSERAHYVRGRRFDGGMATTYSANHPTTAYVKAIDARTGDIRWQTALESGDADFVWTVGGVLSTRTGVVFAGYRNAFHAFDADSGRELWRVHLGGRVRGSPIAFSVGGRQYVAVAAGHAVFAFTLP
jgi:alcohol dehydrogenase (cytochrome c)